VPGSAYGADKSAIANAIADNEAVLGLFYTAFFQGAYGDYAIATQGETVVVSDTQPGRDGENMLRSIERVRFSDRIVNREAME